MSNRRSFIKATGMAAGSLFLSREGFSNKIAPGGMGGKGLTLSWKPYDLQLKHVFTIASNSRTTTPVVLIEIEFDGITGYGEASLPPYLGETQESVMRFLSGLQLGQFNNPLLLDDILDYVSASAPGNYAAKASVDIALHDLAGRLLGHPWHRMWGLNPELAPLTSFTIGIDTPEVVRQKVREAAEFKILKVKLGRDNDREMINMVRNVSDVTLCVDVNQGWSDKHKALEMVEWLATQNVAFVEQPFPVEAIVDTAWLTERSPLPIIADEALQSVDDVLPLKGLYSGINIKLMKCGGLRAARRMIGLAAALGMDVMLGCMTETSCAISAAAQISPLARWADLDGNLLISNDIFDGVKVVDGKITLSDRPGIGVTPL